VSLVASAEYAVRAWGGTPSIYIDGRLYPEAAIPMRGDHQVVVNGDFKRSRSSTAVR
jgi:hypothetical protein